MFVSVIIPLKINWLPVYRCSRTIRIGSRVRVEFAHRLYVGVVAECDVACELPEEQVLEVAEIADGLPAVSANELKLWQFLAEYYMCSIGEVYRAAYPKERVKDEESLCRRAAQALERQKIAYEKQREKLNRKLERLYRRKEKKPESEKVSSEIEAVLRQIAELSVLADPSVPEDDKRGAADNKGTAVIGTTVGSHSVRVVEGLCRTSIYRRLIEEFTSAGGQVLVLTPSIAECESIRSELCAMDRDEQLTETILPCYNTETGIATRRKIITAARSGNSCVIVSTRVGIWLPFSNLRLIIVERENDTYYKVQEPAPRLNARDTAIMLGQIHRSDVILGGDALSLETSLNLASGKFLPLQPSRQDSFDTGCSAYKVRFSELLRTIDPHDLLDLQSSCPRIIDISQERRKKGMAGAISRIVLRTITRLSEIAEPQVGNTQPLQFILIRGWENEAELQTAIERELPDACRKNVIIKSFAEFKRSVSLPAYSIIIVLQADALVSREDFRADEKATQLVAELNSRCCKLIVQTEIPDRFSSSRTAADLMRERKQFDLPPFSRLIDIHITGLPADSAEVGIEQLRSRIIRQIGRCDRLSPAPGSITLRITLPRDNQLKNKKLQLARILQDTERQFGRVIRLIIDVDPL